MFRIVVRQLKNLRKYPVPPEVLAEGRVKLIALIETSPMSRRPSAWFMSSAWRPVMAAAFVVFVVTGGGTFVAAHDALPGEKLYVVKLAGEEFRERMTLTSEQRFFVQAAHASRRLEETERLLDIQGIEGDDRTARVRAAMDRYEGHVFIMNEIVVGLDADTEKSKKRGAKALKTAEGITDRHVQLIVSATRAEPTVASAVLDPFEASFSLENDTFSAMPSDGSDGVADKHRRDRALLIGESLKRIRTDFEDRRDAAAGSPPDDGKVYDGRDDEDDRIQAETGTEVRFDASVQTPLEIRVGM